MFQYFSQCLAGHCTTYLKSVADQHAKIDGLKTYAKWQECVRFYIEKNQNMTFIGDAVNDKILCIQSLFPSWTILTESKSGSATSEKDIYVIRRIHIPNERAIMNALYYNECATMRRDCAKTHKRSEGPIDNFKNEVFTIENADKGSVTYRAVMENYAKLGENRACQARGERTPARHP